MASNVPRLLVTGFGPFPGIPSNPSAEIARRVARSPRWRRLGVAARSLILPTTYAALDEHLAPALRKDPPDAVLMIGVAGRSRRVRIERRALNRASVLLPDAAGRRPEGLALAKGLGPRRFRGVPSRPRSILVRHGIPCEISQNAGRYLCNAAYHAALGASIPVLFIHIPKRPRRSPLSQGKPRLSGADRLAGAMVDVGIGLLRLAPGSRPQVAGFHRAD